MNRSAWLSLVLLSSAQTVIVCGGIPNRNAPPKPLLVLGRARWSPSPGKQALAFSADDSLLYAGGQHGLSTMRVADGEIRTVYRSRVRVTAVLPLPGGERVLIGDDGGSLKELDASTGLLIRELPWGHGTITSLAISPDGTRLAVSRGDQLQLGQIDGEKAEVTRATPEFRPTGPGLPPPGPPWVEIQFNGNRLVMARTEYSDASIYTANSGGRIDLTTPTGKQQFNRLREGSVRYVKPVYAESKVVLTLVENGSATAVPRAQGWVQVNFAWLSPDGDRILADEGWYSIAERRWHPIAFPFPIRDAAFSHDGRWLAAGDYSGVALIEMMSGQEKRWQVSHTRTFGQVTFSPDGKYLASADQLRRVIVWRLTDGSPVLNVEYDRQGSIIPAHAFLSGGRFVYAVAPGRVKIISLAHPESNQTSHQLDVGPGYARFATSPDGQVLLIVTHEMEVKHSEGKVVSGSEMTSSPAWPLEEGPNHWDPVGVVGDSVFVANGREIRLHDARTGKFRYSLPSQVSTSALFSAIKLLPDGSLIASISNTMPPMTDDQGRTRWQSGVYVYQPPDYRHYRVEPRQPLAMNVGQFFGDGRLVMTRPSANEVEIYDLERGATIYRFASARQLISDAALSSDRQRLAVYYADGHIEIYRTGLQPH